MKFVVLVKEVPDTYGDRKLDLATGLADRHATDAVLDEIGERALEVALSVADARPDAEIIVMTMGPESAVAALRKGLSMGADSAVHVVDDGLAGADLGTTARVLAAAIRRIEPDVVLTGNLSTDGSGGVLAAMVAELLDVPNVTSLASVEFADDSVSGRRAVEGGSFTASSALPAVVSITEALPDARFPSFRGIMAGKKKPVETWGLAELEVDGAQSENARSIVIAVAERPAREAGVKVVDDGGDSAEQLADYLVAQRLIGGSR
ncbi:MAG: electron transfer flavoprotein subunit beta/FixA family protein [Actinomycetales bacterium]|nr:electron transfer flavoprotein subunit beta/FixA family protein [Actinomycetales bacterium]